MPLQRRQDVYFNCNASKKVKKGESKIAAKKKFRKTASSPSKRQLSSSSLTFSSLSLPASSLRPLSSSPSVTTAQSCSNQITPTKKKKNNAYLPPGLLPKLSLWLKTDNFEVSSKIKLQHYEIDRFNPEVICSESIKYLKNKDSLPQPCKSTEIPYGDIWTGTN